MRAEVIDIRKVTRSMLENSQTETALLGFRKALALVKSMFPCSPQETRLSLENWLEAEMISQKEFSALSQFYEWEATA